MKPINPEVTSYLTEQDFKAVERIAQSLVREVADLATRAKARQLSVHQVQLVESNLRDLRYRLTRLEAFWDISPK